MIKHIEASLRAKLLSIAKTNNLSLDYIILRYMQEKFILRLTKSKYRENFILKGGLLFLLFNQLNPRVTRDIDFLGKNIDNSIDGIKEAFAEIISIEVNDGLTLDKEQITCERITEDADYEGIRVNIKCSLGKIVKIIQIDIGYGDIVYPEIRKLEYPSFLDPNIKNVIAYSLESVIAEKYEAMIKLSYINSRMKDFYDIYNILNNYDILGKNLKKAVELTFENRSTEIEEIPVIFTKDFITDYDKEKQWNTFIKKLNLEQISFEYIIKFIENFLLPINNAIRYAEEFNYKWHSKEKIWKKEEFEVIKVLDEK